MVTLRLEGEANDSNELLFGDSVDFDCYSSDEVNWEYTTNKEAIGMLSINPSTVISDVVSYAYFLLSEKFHHDEGNTRKIDAFFRELEPDAERRHAIQNTQMHFNLTKHHAKQLKHFLEAMISEHP